MRKTKRKAIEGEIQDTSEKEMSFFGHLEELRKRIFISLAAVIVCSVFAGIFVEDIIDFILLAPAARAALELQNLKPFGQPFLYFKIIFIAGLILASPFVLFQLWRFIAPGLYEKEKKWARKLTFFTSICFFSGVAFSYFIMIPSMLEFASNFGTSQIKNIIEVNEYLSFVTLIVLAAGILFEMPMVAFILSRFGIITAKMMSKYRRHSIVVILIIAAVVTPTPDPISQLIFAAPLFVLYEISVMIAKAGERKKNQVV